MYWESVERGWEGRKRGGNKPLCHTLLHLLYVTDPPSPLPFVLPSSRHCCILSHRDYSYAFILFSTFSIPFFSVTLDERMPSLKKKPGLCLCFQVALWTWTCSSVSMELKYSCACSASLNNQWCRLATDSQFPWQPPPSIPFPICSLLAPLPTPTLLFSRWG